MSTTASSTTSTRNTDWTGTRCTAATPRRCPTPCRRKRSIKCWPTSATNCATGMSTSGLLSTRPVTRIGTRPTPPTSTTPCSAWCWARPTNIALRRDSNTRCCRAMWATSAAAPSTWRSARAICTKSCGILPSATPSSSMCAATAAANSPRPKRWLRSSPIARSRWATSCTKQAPHTTRSPHRNPCASVPSRGCGGRNPWRCSSTAAPSAPPIPLPCT